MDNINKYNVLASILILTLSGCATPKIVFEGAPEGASVFDTSGGVDFRIARSLIRISPDDQQTEIFTTVIDPIDTRGEYLGLPNNEGLYYRLSLINDDEGSVSRAEFEVNMDKTLSSFPVPSCASAKITIATDLTGDSKLAVGKPLSFNLEVVPTEYALPSKIGSDNIRYSKLYRAKGKSNLLSTTKLSITKHDNTQLPKEVGFDVADNTTKTITAIGGLAKAVIPLLGQFERAKDSKILEGRFTTTVTVSTGSRVRMIPMTSKGKVKLHSICGADLVDESASTPTAAIDNTTKLLTEVKSIYDTINAKKDEDGN